MLFSPPYKILSVVVFLTVFQMYIGARIIVAAAFSAQFSELSDSAAAAYETQISEILATLPENADLSTHLKERRHQVCCIWDTEKMIRGREARIITVLFKIDTNTYETRQHKILLDRPWDRFFRSFS